MQAFDWIFSSLNEISRYAKECGFLEVHERIEHLIPILIEELIEKAHPKRSDNVVNFNQYLWRALMSDHEKLERHPLPRQALLHNSDCRGFIPTAVPVDSNAPMSRV